MNILYVSTIGLIFFSSIIYATDYRTSWDGTVYGYGEHLNIRNDSLLNPNNQIATIPSRTATAEVRFNFKLEWEPWQFSARPILLTTAISNKKSDEDAYFSQWQLRFRATDSLNIAAGRDVLNWGPAQFKSLASPFYFDNGRSNPMQELSGMDNIKVSWSPNMETTVALARIDKSGHNLLDTWNDSWLLKIDQRSDEWAGGISILRPHQSNLFVAMFTQHILSDALLLYAEAASSVQFNSLVSSTDSSLPFTVNEKSPRRINALIGAAWTFENGQSLNVEYMRYNHGFDADEERAYFNRAATNYAYAGQALGLAPLLLGRDYVHLVWQSNPLENIMYWRIMGTHSFTDGGNELSGYAKYALNDSLSVFTITAVPIGNSRQEFSSLLHSSITLGLEFAFP